MSGRNSVCRLDAKGKQLVLPRLGRIVLILVNEDESPADLPLIIDKTSLALHLQVKESDLWHVLMNKNKYYRVFYLRRNGKERLIHAPAKTLCWMQHEILHRILYKLPVQEHIAAYVPGRSCRDAAEKHVGKATVLNLDIKDFFHSVKRAMVRKQLRACFSTSAAHMLAELVTYDNFVPQGAPTSGAIANLVAQNTFDADILKRFSASEGWTYTRYSDDLTLSSVSRLEPEQLVQAIETVGEILDGHGFTLNPTKTRWAYRENSQRVLGLVVNSHVAIPRKQYHRLKALVHKCASMGFDECAKKMGRPSGPALAGYLRGALSYVHGVDKPRWEILSRELQEAEAKWCPALG